MHYFPLHDLANKFDLDNTKNTTELKEDILAFIQKNEILDFSLNGKTYKIYELESFLQDLNPQKCLFVDWIKLSPRIHKAVLIHDFTDFRIDKVIYDHKLFGRFKRFVSPFIFEPLKKEVKSLLSVRDFRALSATVKYLELLDEDARLIVENILVTAVEEELENISSKAKNISEERDMIALLELFRNEHFYAVLNALSKSQYATKILPIDSFKALMNNKHLRRNLILTSLNVMQQLDLNPEHKKALNQFVINYRKGKVKSHDEIHRQRVSKIQQWQRVMALILLAVVVIISTYVYLDNTINQSPEIEHAQQGFDSLKLEEMRFIDSLFQPEKEIEYQSEDQSNASQALVYDIPASNKLIKNRSMRDLQYDLYLDYTIQNFITQNGSKASNCNAISKPEYKNFNINNLRNLTAMVDGGTCEFYNNTNWEVYIIVFDNTYDGLAYGKLIPVGANVELMMKKGQYAMFYIGDYMSDFFPNSRGNLGYGSDDLAQLLQGGLNAHFCTQDFQTHQFLDNVFEVHMEKKKLISVLNYDKSNGFSLNSQVFEQVN